jgi:hypothetical protein
MNPKDLNMFYKPKNYSMEEEKKQEPVEPKKEGFLDKAKKLVNKADDFIDDKVEDVKKSEAFKKVHDAIDKAEDYVEDKIEDIKESGAKEKLEAFADKTEVKAEETMSKLKQFGKKVAGKAADKLEDIAENLKKKSADENKPEGA